VQLTFSVAIIDRRVFCFHGELSPELPFVANIATLQQQTEIPKHGALDDFT
jgi:hypothetical protein